jgi:hypothetical protein
VRINWDWLFDTGWGWLTLWATAQVAWLGLIFLLSMVSQKTAS